MLKLCDIVLQTMRILKTYVTAHSDFSYLTLQVDQDVGCGILEGT